MRNLYYSALDIAAIVNSMQLSFQNENRILDRIWEGEKVFLDTLYREDQRRFILDAYHWLQYFYDKPCIDREFPAIQRDFACSNSTLTADRLISDFSDLDLFFKSIRIRILYGNGNDYARIKLRTLLKQYGYKRRSQLLLQHIDRCMAFYHLEVTLRGGVPCSVETVDLDQMLTFRVI